MINRHSHSLLGDEKASKRSASVVCLANCDFLTITRDAFRRAVQDVYKEVKKQREDFLANVIVKRDVGSLSRADIVRMVRRSS